MTPKIKPSARRVLSALAAANCNGLTAIQLAHPSIGGLDYRKRVSELRQAGYVVAADTIVGKPYRRYCLVGVA